MTHRLIIIRHGNTFEAGETPTRVGARTDLPLTAKGRDQAARLGAWLAERVPMPARILAGPLRRTRETAEIIARTLSDTSPSNRSPQTIPPVEREESLREIDYGPDENQPEAVVEERLGRHADAGEGILSTSGRHLSVEEARAKGKQIIARWNMEAAPPPGWLVDPPALSALWRSLADSLTRQPAATWVAVTSNGVARFATALLPNGALSLPEGGGDVKIAPGAACVFERDDSGDWRCERWNFRPAKG